MPPTFKKLWKIELDQKSMEFTVTEMKWRVEENEYKWMTCTRIGVLETETLDKKLVGKPLCKNTMIYTDDEEKIDEAKIVLLKAYKKDYDKQIFNNELYLKFLQKKSLNASNALAKLGVI